MRLNYGHESEFDWIESMESPIKILLSCDGSMITESKVRVLGIEEDIQGRDVLTFQCPKCKQIHTSLRLGR
jgi:hypothetical protein